MRPTKNIARNTPKTDGKKLASYRIDVSILEQFEEKLRELREDYGESITKEAAIGFLLEHALKLKPREFLALYHSHKADKFSKR